MDSNFDINYADYLIRVFFLFIILIGFIYILNFLKNKGFLKAVPLKLRETSNIKIIERFYLENKKGLYIVNIGTRYWFIATTDNNLKVISEVKEKDLNL